MSNALIDKKLPPRDSAHESGLRRPSAHASEVKLDSLDAPPTSHDRSPLDSAFSLYSVTGW